LTNCLTEIFFTEAMEQARRLDDVLKSTGRPIGPLHGVPISIKDLLNVKGQCTTAGYVSYARKPQKEQDSGVVELLRNAGAILYCKTNNPQSMMSLETVNNIYGRTVNPWNNKIGPGGSSGGEGALVAMHGSPLGIGTDVGGSIRVPAAYCGVYGFKPSAKRVSMRGSDYTMRGQESILAVAGPLGHSVDDLELFFQVNSDAKPWLREPLLRMPWRSQISEMQTQKLKIGIMLWDEVVMPHPYITRVIGEVAAKLKAAGHEGKLYSNDFCYKFEESNANTFCAVLDFKAHHHKRAWEEISLPLYFTDGGRDIKQTLFAGNEPIFPSSKRLLDDPIVKERTHHEIWKVKKTLAKYVHSSP
jgi:amidase